jgi:hypothetical protein
MAGRMAYAAVTAFKPLFAMAGENDWHTLCYVWF